MIFKSRKTVVLGNWPIEEGFLTDPQLMTLLSKQKESHIMLGQILVDEGMLTYEAYETLLEDYKKESGFTEEELEVLKRNDTDAIVDIFMKMDRSDDVALFQEYVELFVRNLVRFIDRDVIISKPYVTPRYAFENYASQEIVGSNKIQTGISADESAFTIFAGIYAEEAITEVDDLAKDAIGEFMNCQNGLFISNLYHRNINYDLDPQVFESNGTLQERNQLFVLPCELTFGKIDIIFNL